MMEFGGQTYGLKGKDGELSGQTDGLEGKENILSGQTRGLKGQRGESSGQNSGFEIMGEIGPKVKGLHRELKKMNGQTKRLKGQKGGSQVVFGGRSILKDRLKGKEGDFDGQSDVLRDGKKGLKDQKDGYIGISGFQSYIRDKLSGLEGDFYGQSDEFSGSTQGLYGQKGKSLGRWVIQPYLKDSLPGLEGGLEGVLESDSNEQYSTISSKNSGSEIIGGISPKINMSYDTVKGISGETPILKGQEGDVDGHHDVLSVRGSEFIGGITPQMKGLSGHREDYPDKEGDFYGQSHGLSGQTLGLKGQEGGSLGISGAQPNLKDSLPGLEGDSDEQYNTISSKNSLSEIIGGISPKINMSYDTVKGISGETPILKGQEGDADGHHDVLSVRGSEFIGGITPQMKGLSGHREEYPGKEGEPQVLFGGYSELKDGLKGEEGGSLGISGAQPNLKDSLPSLEGDSYEQYSTISSKNSGYEIIGGISPKINMSYDTVKGISGETYILKGQEGDVDGYHDVLIDRTKGWNGEEGGSLNMKDDFSHFTIESENISTITEENVNPPRKIPTLLFENLLEHSSADSTPDSKSILTSVSNSFSNFGNKIPYIVVPFILILILLGISYKYFGPVWRKKLKKKQDTKKVINLCDKHKNEKEVTNTLTENN
ncbi:CIR protein [Plasmodium chabaudi chabaudi]|uniref:CIR protein n=1 Tax=Plasmodium chabaudi chabaudi TaxID=31271 RepID=A0A4V0KB34_PLACU|nr:CIR protein [Plasmodium chabaudi chabaudi]VTZ69943.1 CIR protein [Plasmodium chabaudi chabaudi]